MDEMSADRQLAVAAMQNMGWRAVRTGRKWEFSRPDTGGLWDRSFVSHGNLSTAWATGIAMSYGDAPDLVAQVKAAEQKWFADRFCGLIAKATGGV
jgi:hypothetical protein